mmetsp:Transcript_143506/g.400039  ORF Transcript_143506/g.400039 Transcript_143506/m.400039 type:complete len:299 (+) Transcript_143506:380-1276(+)
MLYSNELAISKPAASVTFKEINAVSFSSFVKFPMPSMMSVALFRMSTISSAVSKVVFKPASRDSARSLWPRASSAMAIVGPAAPSAAVMPDQCSKKGSMFAITIAWSFVTAWSTPQSEASLTFAMSSSLYLTHCASSLSAFSSNMIRVELITEAKAVIATVSNVSVIELGKIPRITSPKGNCCASVAVVAASATLARASDLVLYEALLPASAAFTSMVPGSKYSEVLALSARNCRNSTPSPASSCSSLQTPLARLLPDKQESASAQVDNVSNAVTNAASMNRAACMDVSSAVSPRESL